MAPAYLGPYQIATYLLLIFCTGHTLGGLFFAPSKGAAADAVLASMKAVHFRFNGADCTYYGAHLGSGTPTPPASSPRLVRRTGERPPRALPRR